VQLVLSHDVAQRAGWSPPAEQLTRVSVKGADGPLDVIDIPRGRDLATSILAPSADEPRTPRQPRGPAAAAAANGARNDPPGA
jgi:hypothetical protein